MLSGFPRGQEIQGKSENLGKIKECKENQGIQEQSGTSDKIRECRENQGL